MQFSARMSISSEAILEMVFASLMASATRPSNGIRPATAMLRMIRVDRLIFIFLLMGEAGFVSVWWQVFQGLWCVAGLLLRVGCEQKMPLGK